MVFINVLFANKNSDFINRLIQETDKQYKKVRDFQVEMEININKMALATNSSSHMNCMKSSTMSVSSILGWIYLFI